MELQHIENGRKRLADLLGALDEEDKQRDRSLDPAGYLWLSVIATRWHVAPPALAGILPFLTPSPRWEAETHIHRFPRDRFPSLLELVPFLSRLGLILEKQLVDRLQVDGGSLLRFDRLASGSGCLIQELLESPFCGHSGWDRLTIEGVQVDSADGLFTEETPYTPGNLGGMAGRPLSEAFSATYATICSEIRGSIWSYYTPSGGGIVALHAILVANGNELRLLCEDEDDFLVISFAGS